MAIIPGGAGSPATFPNGFQILDGSASSPTIRWSSSGTGLYQPAPNQIAFSINGTQVKLITGSSIVFNVPLNIPSVSGQIILSSGINQLTINSGTSSASRSYTIPDVGVIGNFAMLEGLQTFAALKTFNSGIKFGGGSADSLSIWSTLTTLNIRGGTSGLNVSNSLGIVTLDIANSGSLTLGSITNTPYTSFHTIYKNLFSGTPNTASDSNGGWIIGSNSYSDANRQPTRLSGLSGAQISFDPNTLDTNDCFSISVNKVAHLASDVAIKVFGLNSNGSVSIGSATLPTTHRINGSTGINASGVINAALGVSGGNKPTADGGNANTIHFASGVTGRRAASNTVGFIGTYANASSLEISAGETGVGLSLHGQAASANAYSGRFWVGTTDVGSWSSNGAWVFGNAGSTSTSLQHVFNLPAANSYSSAINTAANSLRICASTSSNALLSAKTTIDNVSGMGFISATADNNTVIDMYWQVIKNDNTNHTTLTNTAYAWLNGAGIQIASATRGGAWELGQNNQTILKSLTSAGVANASVGLMANCRLNPSFDGRSSSALTGGGLLITSRSDNNSLPTMTFYVNATGNGVDDNAIPVADVYASGRWIIGATSEIGGSSYPGVSIVGRTDANAPATGFVGESVQGLQTTATNFPATTQYGDGASVTLTSGRWLLSASMLASLNGATATAVSCGIGTTSGNNSSGLTLGDTLFEGVAPTSATGSNVSVPFVIKNINTSTTFYLKVRATYSAGNPQYRCRLTAIRIA